MPADFEKAKQEQETRRNLWRQQQQARIQKRLPEDLSANHQNNKQGRKGTEDEQESVPKRNFRAIASRLRKQKLEESKKKGQEQKRGGKIAEAKKKIKNVKEAAKNLKNIYRVINGASAVTLVGIIITFLVMNAQLIFGNGLKLKIVPKLSFPEIFIVLFVDFVIFIALMMLFLSICMIIVIIMEHPYFKVIKAVT